MSTQSAGTRKWGQGKLQAALLIALLLAACSPQVTVTSVPTATPTISQTRPPSQPATPSSTLIPTFDAESAVTNTPAAYSSCPQANPGLVLAPIEMDYSLPIGNEVRDAVVAAVEQGASAAQIRDAYAEYGVIVQDFSGDGIPEIAYPFDTYLSFLSCIAEEYSYVYTIGGDLSFYFAPEIIYVGDMNLDGTPEMVVHMLIGGTREETGFQIYEWNGGGFNPLLVLDYGAGSAYTARIARALYWYDEDWLILRAEADGARVPTMKSVSDFRIEDIDGNGTIELFVRDYGPYQYLETYYEFGPWRDQEVGFDWNGKEFIYASLRMEEPSYRFQAVQDADRLFLLEEYELARGLYTRTIEDDELDWWSDERPEFNMEAGMAAEFNEPTPTSLPENKLDRSLLSAYAMYRLVLLELAEGNTVVAQQLYQELMAYISAEPAGSGYAEMASILWDNYQETPDLADACDKVVNYVAYHSSLLDPLGKGHGYQSHIYQNFDVCPFSWLASIPNP